MMPARLPRLNRPSLAFLHDIVMAAGSFALAASASASAERTAP